MSVQVRIRFPLFNVTLPIIVIAAFGLAIFGILHIIAEAYPHIYEDYPLLFKGQFNRSQPNIDFLAYLFIVIVASTYIVIYAKGEQQSNGNIEKQPEAIPDYKLAIIQDDLQQIKKQLYTEAAKLSRYSYINLGIGTFTTFIAITILYLTLTAKPNEYRLVENPDSKTLEIQKQDSVDLSNTDMSYLMHLIPRVSLSILIELFAFFFLRLYRNNLSELKYYNNEIVNIKMKIVALKAAAICESDNLEEIIKMFAETERNFILKKGETTVELQKDLIEASANNKLVESLTSILKSKS